jgi:hypothetical protein
MRVVLIVGVCAGLLQALLGRRQFGRNGPGGLGSSSWEVSWLWACSGSAFGPTPSLFCALLLESISRADDFLKGVAAMRRPSIALISIAGYVLFFNDWGRELGVSLLGEKYLWQIIVLALALMD